MENINDSSNENKQKKKKRDRSFDLIRVLGIYGKQSFKLQEKKVKKKRKS